MLQTSSLQIVDLSIYNVAILLSALVKSNRAAETYFILSKRKCSGLIDSSRDLLI